MKTSNIFEQNPKKTIVVVVFSVLLMVDIISANLYKLLFGHDFLERMSYAEKVYRVPSDIYHHDLAKNIDLDNVVWGPRKYAIATDSLGFKSDRPKDTPMVSEKYRIVFIGDSFTEGVGIPYQDTFVGKIAETLLKGNIEVLNAALSSYSPIIYYRKILYLIDLGLRFNEIVVFIDISDVPDEALNYEMSPSNTVMKKEVEPAHKSRFPKTKNIIKKNSIATYFLIEKAYSIGKEKPAFNINSKRSLWTIDENAFKEYAVKGLNRSEFYMDQLYHLLKLHNIGLTIAVYPWPDQIVKNDLNSLQVTYWRKWAQQKQVIFLNYFPCFINKTSQKQTGGYDILEKYFIKGDSHWNEEGHQLIANEYLSYYSRQNGKTQDQGVTPDRGCVTIN